jgi:pseudoazurin
MLLKKLQLIFILGLFGTGLVACGGDDSSSGGIPDTPKSMAKSGAVEAYDPDVPSMVVEDNGVVHEEEIYKNWPQQASEASNDSATMVNTSSNVPLEAYDPDVPPMVVEDNGVVQQEEIYKNWPAQITAESNDSASAEQTQEAPSAAAVETKTHTVFGRATSFSPNILFINPGDTVKWENMTIHDSVSMEGLIPDGAEPWVFKIGQNGAVTLTVEGVYIYKCNPHYPLGMVAAIIVGKPVNIAQVQANATGRSKGIVIKVVKALAKM